jgi:hypothetical protein
MEYCSCDEIAVIHFSERIAWQKKHSHNFIADTPACNIIRSSSLASLLDITTERKKKGKKHTYRKIGTTTSTRQRASPGAAETVEGGKESNRIL